MKKIARVISDILSPPVWLPVIQFILIRSTSSPAQLILSFASVFIFMLAVPFIMFLYLVKNKAISDIDITDRKERFSILIGSLFSMICLLGILFYMQNIPLFKWELLLTVILFINFLITLFWKISFHMAVNIIGSIIVVLFFGPSSVFVLATVPFVAWSRLILKKHTPAQLIAAFLLNGALLLYGFYYFIH